MILCPISIIVLKMNDNADGQKDHWKRETSSYECLCFADGNEGSKTGSTVTAAVIGIIVPMGECGPRSLRGKRDLARGLGESPRRTEHLAC